MSNAHNDEWFEARREWLEERGSAESDVMENEKGEYILGQYNEEPDNHEVIYLPDNFQSSNDGGDTTNDDDNLE